jgi:hypothetical protein
MEMNEEGWFKVGKKKRRKDMEKDENEQRKDWKGKESNKEGKHLNSSTSFAEAVWKAMSGEERKKKKIVKTTYLQSGSPGFRECEDRELKIKPATYNGRVFSGFVSY